METVFAISDALVTKIPALAAQMCGATDLAFTLRLPA
jgi:hypothetical protein